MQKHTRIYFEALEAAGADPVFTPVRCEVCHAAASDIHHIQARQMGGSKQRDFIENLMALCTECHSRYGDETQHFDFLVNSHLNFMKRMDINHVPDRIKNIKENEIRLLRSDHSGSDVVGD